MRAPLAGVVQASLYQNWSRLSWKVFEALPAWTEDHDQLYWLQHEDMPHYVKYWQER